MAERRRTAKAGLVVGLLVGLPLGGALAWGLVARAKAVNAARWASVPVLVASRPLSAGRQVVPGDLVEAAFPASLVTASCATPPTRARFEGRTLRWDLAEGAVMRDTDLVEPTRACAARVEAAGKQLGLPTDDALVATLRARHGGAP